MKEILRVSVFLCKCRRKNTQSIKFLIFRHPNDTGDADIYVDAEALCG